MSNYKGGIECIVVVMEMERQLVVVVIRSLMFALFGKFKVTARANDRVRIHVVVRSISRKRIV
jgi:hypothetical protein